MVESQKYFLMLRFMDYTFTDFLLLKLELFVGNSAIGKLLKKSLNLVLQHHNFRILLSSHILAISYLFFKVFNFRNHWTKLVLKF